MINNLEGKCDVNECYVEIKNIDGAYTYTPFLKCTNCGSDLPIVTEKCAKNEMLLKYEFPEGAFNIKWRIGRSGETDNDPSLEWSDYETDGICVNKNDVSNVWTKYQKNGEDIIEPPNGELLVNIEYDSKSTNISSVLVTVNYSNDAILKQYKVGDSGWLDYKGPFVVTENTTVMAKVGKNIQIFDVDGTLLGESLITNIDSVNIRNIGLIPSYDSISPSITILDPVYETEKARVSISYPFNVSEENYRYKLNSGEEKTYTGDVVITGCGKDKKNIDIETLPNIDGEENVNIDADGNKINKSAKLGKEKTFESYKINNISIITDKNGKTTFKATITNTGDDANGKLVNVIFIDKKDNKVSKLPTYIRSLKKDESMDLVATIDKDLSNAYNFYIENK